MNKGVVILNNSQKEIVEYCEDEKIAETLQDIFIKIDILNVNETLLEFNKKLSSSNPFLQYSIKNEVALIILENINIKLFNFQSPFNQYLHELMLSKGLQVYINLNLNRHM